MQDVILRYKPTLDQRNQNLVLELGADLPPVYIDQSRVEQVKVNLLSNACKYSPLSSPILLCAAKNNEGLLIEVTDQGRGIAPEDQPKLFQPYQRVGQDTQKIKGLGSGLTIVKQIV